MNLEEKIEKLAQLEKEVWSEGARELLVAMGIHQNSSSDYARTLWWEINTHWLNLSDYKKTPYREWARKIIDLLEGN